MELSISMADDRYRRDLGDGLALRWSTPDDVERVVALYAQVFRRTAESPLNVHMPIWTRDMFSGRHPHIGPRDFAVVEDTRTGALVASTCLLGYACEYEGIRFQFGRPEVVASLPDYRRRGLIRAIFDLIHARSDARGDLVQGITGIEYYYRQFGYEYAVELDSVMTIYFAALPELKKAETEPYALREATAADVPLLRRLWDRARAYAGTSTVIEDEYWHWVITGMHPDALERWRVYVVIEPAGHAAGYLTMMPGRWGPAVTVDQLMVEEGVPMVRMVPSVLRGVRALAETTKAIRPETPPPGAINLRLGNGHPVRSALGDLPVVDSLSPNRYPYAWYIRVADLPHFLRHVAPVLERRLAESLQAGYTGELTLDFYRGGLSLAIARGKLTAIEQWQRPVWGEAKAGFPPLVFLQLVFGHRSLHELRTIYPDVRAEGDAQPVLDALFPKRPAALLPLD
jgi:hypothetical protein